jgi:D-sedoheptulose 7-phosphate isomerase
MAELIQLVKSELEQSRVVLEQFLSDSSNLAKIQKAAELLHSAFSSGKKVISCGNGGSHCDAMHFAEELTGRYRENRKPFAALAISDPSHISCVSNDYGYQHVFSRFVEAIGNSGDILFAISTSGNSENVIRAAEAAKQKRMSVVSLTGNSGGKLASLSDVEIRVPHNGFADRIQEVHIKIIHILILLVEKLSEGK